MGLFMLQKDEQHGRKLLSVRINHRDTGKSAVIISVREGVVNGVRRCIIILLETCV